MGLWVPRMRGKGQFTLGEIATQRSAFCGCGRQVSSWELSCMAQCELALSGVQATYSHAGWLLPAVGHLLVLHNTALHGWLALGSRLCCPCHKLQRTEAITRAGERATELQIASPHNCCLQLVTCPRYQQLVGICCVFQKAVSRSVWTAEVMVKGLLPGIRSVMPDRVPPGCCPLARRWRV